ncbi:MAG TPA: hypothetical protein PKL31_16430, partial [Fulvivirga sp.]|nr:hypothetical protein [Fulvivirga sp.]
ALLLRSSWGLQAILFLAIQWLSIFTMKGRAKKWRDGAAGLEFGAGSGAVFFQDFFAFFNLKK